ncbi:UNVERIFIED_CONTAM: hypothetical protein GTU68_034055 [Idotea baltica]|nr:hypothetical protein [Idotea baltica]
MSNYAVGDIQGCLEPLKKLLDKVSFDPGKDKLWSVGDVVNRGPHSLETLRFCYNLGNRFRMVLGNHDLHLIATAKGFRKPSRNDTLDKILKAPDRDELLDWLQQQPLMIEAKDHVLVHAGIPPQWSLKKAKKLANEMSDVLHCDDKSTEFFKVMYGNEPDVWEKNLSSPLRWRLITNYFTRMRFCSDKGHLELTCKNLPEKPPKGFSPWFEHENRLTKKTNIIFGHWAALAGSYCGEHLFPLDTGYIWGGPMRLMNMKTKEYTHQRK